jgi:hypothetical protein
LAGVHIVETGTKPIFRVDDEANDITPLLIDANGAVGIRTNIPSGATLHLNNTSTNTINMTSGTAANTITIEDTAFLRFGANTSYKTHVLVVGDTYAGGGPGRINFRYLNYLAFDNVNGISGTGTERFRIDALGNIGIGTTSPLAGIHIVETGTRDAFRVDDVANDTTPFIVKADGNVGIGKTTPTSTLDVNGTVAAIAFSGPLSGTATNTSNVIITDDTTTNAVEYITFVGSTSGNQPVATSSTKLTFNPGTGNVGIGTTVPRVPLDVNGPILISNTRISSTIANTITVPGLDITGALDLSLDDNTSSLTLSTSNIHILKFPVQAEWG